MKVWFRHNGLKPIQQSKKGIKNVVENYRPISITSVVFKIMKSIIRDHLVEHMVSNNLFADSQHGFVPNRDCISNLLLALEDWTQAIELGYSVHLIYTDYTKTFDSVSHKRLLVKLESTGIKGEVMQWIITFLTNRRHSVSVEGKLSNWAYAKSGVPQSSVLGPIIFDIFINDVPNLVRSSCKHFADDAKIYTSIKTNADTSSLQGDINSIFHKWNLPFNEVMPHFGCNLKSK